MKTLAERPQGSLSSNAEKNPLEHVKAITLRSGQEIESRPLAKNGNEEVAAAPKNLLKDKEKEEAVAPTLKPRTLHPAQLKKDQSNDQFRKFLELFKKLHINIPIVEPYFQMPHYAKLMIACLYIFHVIILYRLSMISSIMSN